MNAFTGTMMYEMIDAFDQVDADDDVRAVIVTGAGRAFCAGADLGGGGERSPVEAATSRRPEGVPRDGGGMVSLRIFECTKPVIGAINGAAVGVGVTMTLPMDIRLASDQAKFGFVFARRGHRARGVLVVVPATGRRHQPRRRVVLQRPRLPRRRGARGRAGAQRAPRRRTAGGRQRHRPRDRRQHRAVSVALTRQMLWRMLGASHPMEAHRVDSRGIQSRGASDDAREGVDSFLEKRPAVYPVKVSDGLPDIFPDYTEPEFH